MGQRSRKRRADGARGSVPQATPTRQPRRTSEERNAEIRERLEPLAPGERPGAVTAAAIVALLLAAANLVSYFAGVEIEGEKPAPGGIVFFCGLMLAAAFGMWKAKYWAVLGFQTLLLILVVVFFLLLMQASDVVAALICLGVILPAGYLFFKLIRAMARIQMPERRGT